MKFKRATIEQVPEMKFKKMTIGQIQELRDEYAQRIANVVVEFKEKTGLDITEIYLEPTNIGTHCSVEVQKVI